MRYHFCSLFFLLIGLQLQAQVTLKPTIGLATQPLPTDSICQIPLYLGDFDTTGIPVGDTVPDFTLYDLSGNAVSLSGELGKGKPVLLVSGSYTCPVFRGKIPLINQLAALYANDLNILVIYALEAHPEIDISPYFGYVNLTNANVQDSVLYRQPLTYGERMTIATDLLADLPLQVPLLLDGPCNEWWSAFGPAPQNAYLIDTNGTVFAKHGWFHKFPDNIFCDLDSLLGQTGGNCSGGSSGQFTFNMVSDTFDLDLPEQTLSVYGELNNPSADDVLIRIVKLQTNLPSGWAASLCTDVCYPSTIDTALVLLPAGQSQFFTFYFYTDSIPGMGLAKIGFRNESNFQNSYVLRVTGTTDENFVGLETGVDPGEVKCYPNPASGHLNFSLPKGETGILSIYDLTGKLKFRTGSGPGVLQVPMENFPRGFYVYVFEGSSLQYSGNFMKE